MLLKISKYSFFLLFLSLILSYNAYSQVEFENTGTSSPFKLDSSSVSKFQNYKTGQQLIIDGYRPPITSREERLSKKANRLSLTNKEKFLLLKKERLSQQNFSSSDTSQVVEKLTLWEQIQYPFVKYKKKRHDKFIQKYIASQAEVPAYEQKALKYRLTPEEETVMQKAKDSSVQLTPKELKIKKRAERKQKKYNKIIKKFTPVKLTPEEDSLLKLPSTDSLSKEQKKKYKEALKKRKLNQKIKQRKAIARVDSAFYRDGWTLQKGSKYKLLTIWRALKSFSLPSGPSQYDKKLKKYESKMRLSNKEAQAVDKYKRLEAGLLTPKERHIAQKALNRQYKYRKKIEKLKRKQFLAIQHPATRKMLKRNARLARKNKRTPLYAQISEVSFNTKNSLKQYKYIKNQKPQQKKLFGFIKIKAKQAKPAADLKLHPKKLFGFIKIKVRQAKPAADLKPHPKRLFNKLKIKSKQRKAAPGQRWKNFQIYIKSNYKRIFKKKKRR